MSVRLPSGVLAQFATTLALVTNASSSDGTLTPSGYRWTLDKEPDSGMDGKYFLSLESITPRERNWGTGENVCDGVIVVQVSYFRGGGDLDGGDRQSVMRNASDDMQIIADVCENPQNYASTTTGVRDVIFRGATKIHDLKRAEVWEARFWFQWRSDLATTPVVELEPGVIYAATRADLAARDATRLQVGAVANVIDIGNGFSASYLLIDDTRAADAKLRIAAYGVSGRAWVAGDGVMLPYWHLSDKVDFTQLSSGTVLVPAFTSSGWLYVNDGTTNRLDITDFAGTLSGNTQGSVGNNASHNNFVSAATNIITAGAAFNTNATDGVPFTVGFVGYGGNTKMTDLSTAITVSITTAATGTGLTLKGRFYMQGYLMASETMA